MARFLAAIAVLIAAAFATATPAHADTGPSLRWKTTSVCVEDRTDSGLWPVLAAVARADLAFRFELIYGCDADHPQQIRVSDGAFPSGKWTGIVKYDTDGDHIPDAGPAKSTWIHRAWVHLNNIYADNWHPDELQTIVVHELLHALGAPHNEHQDSIMGPVDHARQFREPTARDIAAMDHRYAPRGYTYRPAWKYLMPA